MRPSPPSTPAPPSRPGGDGATDLRLEALRGAAALLVVLAHYGHLLPLPAGSTALATTGVDLFFVLSGFVFAPYLAARGWSYRAHLVRRLLRIYPLYLLALAAYVALKWPAPDATAHLGAHLLMAHTLASPEVAFFYNPAFWSLPPELQFYLLLPLLAAACLRWGLWPVLAAALALRVALLLPPLLGEAASPAWRVATVHLPGVLCEFLLGAAVWAAARRGPIDAAGTAGAAHAAGTVGTAGAAGAAPRRLPAAALLAGAVALLALAGTLMGLAAAPAAGAGGGGGGGDDGAAARALLGGLVGAVAAAAYALVLAAVLRAPPPRAGWAVATAAWAGHLSYGVYLLHNAAPPLLQRVAPGLQGPALAAAALALTLLAAALAHRLVERPARDWGRALSRRLASRS
jgi:peptidoglycan/LPS O-acetylase OafA/YrhL